MPLIREQVISDFGITAIWQITEDLSYFKQRLNLSVLEKSEYEKIGNKKRKLEWIAVRYLLHVMVGEANRTAVFKDEFGKPFLDNSKLNISLSHCNDYAAVILSHRNCGIDIQQENSKVLKIAPKFLSENDLKAVSSSPIFLSTLLWSGKEAIYKGYGKKEIDYREDISIDAFSRKDDYLNANGQLNEKREYTFFLFKSS